MTLNLWRYHDWDKRSDNIASLINKEAPDCIAFQEVLTNHAFSDFPFTDIIADKCGYKYRTFAPTLVRNNSRDKEGNRTQRASEGQAFISKFPIITSENYFLKQHPAYPEDVTVLFQSVEVADGLVEFCNVHFANNDISYKHLDELLELIEKRATTPIILGDFNIYKLAEYKKKNQFLNNYSISSEIDEYVSYEPDGEPLDYIAVPSSKYEIKGVVCSDIYVSDHKALIAIIASR